jgi:hypothetical protein
VPAASDGAATPSCCPGEQSELSVEASGKLVNRQGRDPGRRQLDRERDAVESSADLDHGRQARIGHREIRLPGPGPFHGEAQRAMPFGVAHRRRPDWDV